MKNPMRQLRLVVIVFALLVFAPLSSHASNKISSPDVTGGQVELEYRGGFDFDETNSKNHQETNKFVVNYGITERWRTEFKGVYSGKSSNLDWSYAEWSHRWQIFEAGESWLKLSVQANYKFALQDTLPDKLENTILASVDTGKFTHTTNVNFENELGKRARGGTDFNFGIKNIYNYDPRFSPGIETYVGLGKFRSSSKVSPDKYQIGPVLTGKFSNGFKYDVGYLFGANKAVPDGRIKCLLTYAFKL